MMCDDTHSSDDQVPEGDRLQRLLQMLTDVDPKVRFDSVRALGALGDTRAIDPLVTILKGDDDADVKSEAAASLKELGAPALPWLIELLGDGDRQARGWAAAALDWAAADLGLRDERAIEPLRALLDDDDSDVRRAAAAALRMLKHWPPVPVELRQDAYVSTVKPDHHQFFFCDHIFDGDTQDEDDRDYTSLLSVGPTTFIRVGTKSQYGPVPVAVEVLDAAPDHDFSGWDHVEEVSLDVPSGGIAFGHLFGYRQGQPPDVTVTPGTYRVRLYCGNLDHGAYIRDDDFYRFVLWPAPYEGTRILLDGDPWH